MKNIYLLFLLLLGFIHGSAQLDREHWFAPMADRISENISQTFNRQRLYLSTNRQTPFTVSIYNNNTVIATAVISKGNPAKVDIPREMMMATSNTELFTVGSKGIRAVADYPFFANFRFSVFNHGEIITSKGLAALGTKFYAAVTPTTAKSPIINYTTGFIATEDGTVVTVSGYKSGTVFSNGWTQTTHPTITITLNRGQSYILEGISTDSQTADDFIGAKIESNKPISVTNGNFNGQHALNTANSTDIFMDQSVPVAVLGNAFALVKGKGADTSNVERVLVIATQNNTAVYCNNETTPVATLNEGEYYLIPGTKYVNQGPTHQNMYVRTTANAYVYQLLAGSSDDNLQYATGGFNFIPSLSCYLPYEINEIGLIDENEVATNQNPGGILNVPTDFNIITEAGASVQINNIPLNPTYGPFPMTGTPNWVSYTVPNVSGNITITSTKSITGGIIAGSNAVGYGGYFTGFPVTPKITVSGGACAPGAVLSVEPQIFEMYQWLYNGQPIPNANGTSYTPTMPGTYTVQVKNGSCAPVLSTSYSLTKCTVNSTATYTTCKKVTIQPTLSAASIPQNVAPATVQIVQGPTKGTISINPVTGEIVYLAANVSSTGTDTFVYTFCGNHPQFPECETVTVTISFGKIDVNDATKKACKTPQQNAVYNLTTASVTALSPATITYYPTLTDAQNENPAALISTPTAYTGTAGQSVYAVVKNNEGCRAIAKITLEYYPEPTINTYQPTFCDDDFDNVIPVATATVIQGVLGTQTGFTAQVYLTAAEAAAGTNPQSGTLLLAANATVYVRVDSSFGCPPIIVPVKITLGAPLTVNQNILDQNVCDSDLSGSETINPATFASAVTTDPAISLQYFLTLADAQQGQNAISSVLVSGQIKIFVRATKPGFCPAITSFNINLKGSRKSDILKDQQICIGSKTTLDAGPGYTGYTWSTGQTTQSITDVPIGTYWVDLNYNGCVYRQTVYVSALPQPKIEKIEIKDQTVTVMVTGGTSPYEYSADGITWQSSNVFTFSPGTYTLYVRDNSRCTPISRVVTVIKLINAISPNQDGYNDFISYKNLASYPDLQFVVYDRYGAPLFTGTPANNFTWDGRTLGGRHVTTGTYWYTLSYKDPETGTTIHFESFLLVKNVN